MRIPLFNIIFLFALTALVDAYILYDVRSYSSRASRKKMVWIFAGILMLCLALLIVSISLPRKNVAHDIQPVMWTLFTYISLFVPAVIYCICSLIGRLINIGSRRLVNYGAMVGVPFAIIAFLIMWWGVLYTRHAVKVRDVTVESAKIPSSFDGYKIVQFSDIHLGTWGRDTVFISKLVDEINSQNPDLIVFTGDIVNRKTSEMEPFVSVLRHLKASDGVYSILGNHDYGDYAEWNSADDKKSNLDLMTVWQNQIGWKMLNNSHTFLHHKGDSIALIGVQNWGEPPFKQYGNLKKAFSEGDGNVGAMDKNFKILLTHNPVHWEREVKKFSNIDLTMSGHTHAMQIEMDIAGKRYSPASLRYSEWGGLYNTKSKDGETMFLYVNIGAGEVGIPMRIGATPEITVYTLRRAG